MEISTVKKIKSIVEKNNYYCVNCYCNGTGINSSSIQKIYIIKSIRNCNDLIDKLHNL